MLIEKGAELHRPKCHVTSPTEVRVRSGPQSRHVRIARLRAADNPDAVVGLQGLLNGGTHIAERIGFHRFRFHQIVTMDSMLAHRWDGDPWSRAVVIAVERRSERPGIKDNQIIRTSVLFEFVRHQIDVGQAFLSAFPKGERQ